MRSLAASPILCNLKASVTHPNLTDSTLTCSARRPRFESLPRPTSRLLPPQYSWWPFGLELRRHSGFPLHFTAESSSQRTIRCFQSVTCRIR
jgi:hypothetical protein